MVTSHNGYGLTPLAEAVWFSGWNLQENRVLLRLGPACEFLMGNWLACENRMLDEIGLWPDPGGFFLCYRNKETQGANMIFTHPIVNCGFVCLEIPNEKARHLSSCLLSATCECK